MSFIGYLIIGILIGAISSIVSLLAGSSILTALGVYSGTGCISVLILAFVRSLRQRARLGQATGKCEYPVYR
jgi:hypothetical protein